MIQVSQPATAAQVQEALAWALAEGEPLELAGRGSKRDLGRPLQATRRVDLSRLSGITLYEPEELVMVAGAGTSLAEVEASLADARQQLAFEPADLGPLLGAAAGAGSIGGVFACNLAGPRRFKVGAARDHLLGFQAVSGRAEFFKSGGRVVKNVTGYDLSKLMSGSFGTLAALTQVCFKVLPMPEAAATLMLFDLADQAAVAALGEAAGSPHEVSGLAHMPPAIAGRSAVPAVARAGAAVTAIRLEGPPPSVRARLDALRRQFAHLGLDELGDEETVALWRDLRDVTCFAGEPERCVWRISVPPSAAAAVVARLRESLAEAACDWFYDWAGGLIWLALGGDPRAAEVRAAIGAGGGHATLIRAPEPVRALTQVFQPQPEPLARLTERVKDSFDPRRILNPGRMYPGV